MAVVYIPDELITKIHNTGTEKSAFIKNAIEEKLQKIPSKELIEK